MTGGKTVIGVVTFGSDAKARSWSAVQIVPSANWTWSIGAPKPDISPGRVIRSVALRAKTIAEPSGDETDTWPGVIDAPNCSVPPTTEPNE
jgi:hypothetical protein